MHFSQKLSMFALKKAKKAKNKRIKVNYEMNDEENMEH